MAVFFTKYVGADACTKQFSQTDKCEQEWECVYGCAENRDRLVAAAANGVNRNCLSADTNYAGSVIRTLSAECSDAQLQQLYSDGMFSAENCKASSVKEYQACLVKTPYADSTLLLYIVWLASYSVAAGLIIRWAPYYLAAAKQKNSTATNNVSSNSNISETKFASISYTRVSLTEPVQRSAPTADTDFMAL